MLRIRMAQTGAGTAVVHLEGQVIGPWVAELERVCDLILARGSELHLDLSTVSFVDRDGVELLARLRDGHARLLNCSRFVSEQLKVAGDGGFSGAAEDRA
jgi:anti-anti-sigma regulatory factor